MRFATSLVLTSLACSGSEHPPCMEGFVPDGKGRCRHDGDRDSQDTSPPPISSPDSGDAPDPLLPRGDCVAGTAEGTTALQALGRTDTDEGTEPGSLLIEMLDSALDGDRFWAVGQGGLFSFDLSGANPELNDHYPNTGGRYHRLLLLEGTESHPPLVYATHRSQGLAVIDRSDPSALSRVHQISKHNFGGLVRRGDFVYIIEHDGDLTTMDVSDPVSPVEGATVYADGHPWNVVAGADALYTADNTHGIGVFSLDNPANPTFEGHIDIGTGALDVAVDSEHLYAAAGSAGLIVLEHSDPYQPREIARLNLGTPIIDVALDGGVAWLVDQESVWAVDITVPTHPVVLGKADTPRFSMTVAAADNRAWVGDWTAVGGYALDTSISSPVLSAAPDTLYLAPGQEDISLKLRNDGAVVATLSAWSASHPEATFTLDATTIPPGTTAAGLLHWPTDLSNGTVCIASDDPASPALEVHVVRENSELSIPLGTAAPDFVLTDIDGETHRLSEQLGHPVLLVYFATW
jgi:hypothetical protein